MTKLLSAIVAALFAVASLTPAFAADEKKSEAKAMEKKDEKAADKKKADEKKSDVKK